MRKNKIMKIVITFLCLIMAVTVLSSCGKEKGIYIASMLSKDSNVIPIGGRIFYISESENGAEYTFYDKDMNKLENHTLDGLKDAYYYEKTGESESDKFFVYATKLGKPENSIIICKGLRWGPESPRTLASDQGIGGGKSNTEIVMGQYSSQCCTTFNFVYDSIWNWLKNEINDEEIGGLNGHMDWYIPSNQEMETLFKFKPAGFFDGKYWTSSEESAEHWGISYAYYFFARNSKNGTFNWFSGGKASSECCAVAIRSF